MNFSMELDVGDPEVRRSKNSCGVSQLMNISGVLREIGENRMKIELTSPGPTTPTQAAPLPQQKLREAITSSSGSAAPGAMHCSDAAKSSLGPHLASTALHSLPAPSEDDVDKHEENGSVGAVNGGVGLPSGSHTRGSPEDRTMPDPRIGDEMRVASKSMEDEPSMSRCCAMERSSCGRSVTSMGRPSSKVKVESPRVSVDGGVCLESNAGRDWRSQERGGREVSRVLGGGGRCGDESGATLAANGRDGEGAGVLGLSQGRGVDAGGASGVRDEEWKGKYVGMSLGLGGFCGSGEEGRVEHRLGGVVEADVGSRGEQGAKGCRESSSERWAKRVKREAVESGMGAEEWRGQRWGTNEAEVRGRGSMDDEPKQEEWRSVLVRDGGGGVVPQGWGEKAVARGVGSVGCGEARTVVVKKTPKRVHNSEPSGMSRRPEVWMWEECAKSPMWRPQAMLSSAKKQGVKDAMVARDSASGGRMREAGESGRGGESGVEFRIGVGDGKSVESRVERGSACCVMSGSKQGLSLSGPGLPLSLNFSAKTERAAVSSCRTSTEEEWGKSLALCGPGGESAGEAKRSGEEVKAMSYEERFVELELFLKKCDEDDQSYLLDGLRSLSAAGRSSHAVVLEERALLLSMEEGKEMSRVKSLNVMGQRGSWKGGSEMGSTPQGLRGACFGSGGEQQGEQQLVNEGRSPGLQMHMQMVMSGSRSSAGLRERISQVLVKTASNVGM